MNIWLFYAWILTIIFNPSIFWTANENRFQKPDENKDQISAICQIWSRGRNLYSLPIYILFGSFVFDSWTSFTEISDMLIILYRQWNVNGQRTIFKTSSKRNSTNWEYTVGRVGCPRSLIWNFWSHRNTYKSTDSRNRITFNTDL